MNKYISPSIRSVTLAIAAVATSIGVDYVSNEADGSAVNIGSGPRSLMGSTAKGIRRRLARQGVPRRQGCRPVGPSRIIVVEGATAGHRPISRPVQPPIPVVQDVLKKRTEATRQRAVQSWIKDGSVPKARASAKRRPMPASAFPTAAQLAEAGMAGERATDAVETTSHAAAE